MGKIAFGKVSFEESALKDKTGSWLSSIPTSVSFGFSPECLKTKHLKVFYIKQIWSKNKTSKRLKCLKLGDTYMLCLRPPRNLVLLDKIILDQIVLGLLFLDLFSRRLSFLEQFNSNSIWEWNPPRYFSRSRFWQIFKFVELKQ